MRKGRVGRTLDLLHMEGRRKEEESRETKCSGREEGREVTSHCVLLTQERPGTKCRVYTACVLPQDKQIQDREKRNASC